MLKISSDSLKDFQTCALLYDLRYGENKTKEYIDIRDRRAKKFDDTIKRVVAFFFYKKQAFSEPSYQALLNRWQKLWFAEGTTTVDIATGRNEIVWGSDTSYTTQAAHALLVFHEEFSNNPEQTVILVDEKFCVPLDKEIALEGTIDLVLREKIQGSHKFVYKIYKWTTTSAKRSTAFWTFDMAFLEHAFKYRNPQSVSVGSTYYLWNFGGNTIGPREVELDKEDYNLLKYWANEIKNTEIFAPRRGLTSHCKSCVWYDNKCLRWRLPEPK